MSVSFQFQQDRSNNPILKQEVLEVVASLSRLSRRVRRPDRQRPDRPVPSRPGDGDIAGHLGQRVAGLDQCRVLHLEVAADR